MNKRSFILGVAVGSVATTYLTIGVIKRQDIRYKKLERATKLNLKVIQSFIEHSEFETLRKVNEEVEFDWVVQDLVD